MATATAEPATNGTAGSPTTSIPVDAVAAAPSNGTKRKRADSEEVENVNGALEEVSATASTAERPQSLQDILHVLRKHDTKPSILDAPIPEHSDDKATSEPTTKRAKLADSATPTVARRLEGDFYASLQALEDDVAAVIDELLASVKSKEISLPQTQYGRPTSLTTGETRLWVGTIAFQKVLKGIVHAEKERQRLIEVGKALVDKDGQASAGAGQAVVKTEEDEEDQSIQGKPVLTLFANAPGPKQLFSSFQRAGKLNGVNDVTPPLREAGLPGFISTTTITPLPAAEVSRKPKGPTIGELFGPTSDKYKLQPPKPAKTKLVTTGNTVDFVRIDGPVRPNRRNSYNYFTDKLAVGQWFSYGGLDIPSEPTSPQAKRKQRDRALSTGEAFMQPTEGEKLALRKARNDALFRRVYSSFAPSYDDSTAIVPKDVRNQIWMDRVEERLAQNTIIVDPALLEPEVESTPEERERELEELGKMVENFDPAVLQWDEGESKEEKEMDDLLLEVSDLLETLAAYQRIRNTSLSTSARTSVGPSNTVTDLTGTPTSPSSGEMEIYKTLKLQLALLVNQLPPYAVARLNGDQLAELNIKSSILIETEDARGVMAEDEATRAAKIQAYAAASGTQTQAPRPPAASNYANYSANASQFNRTPAQPAQALRAGASQTYYTPSSQSQARPAAASTFQRSSSGVSSYATNYGTPASRASYQHSFPQTASRPNTYQAQNSQYYSQLQNAAANKTGYTQNYNATSTPQASRPSYAQTPATSYQPRPGGTAPMYSGYPQAQSPHARTSTNSTAVSSGAARPAYNTPGAAPSYYRPPHPQQTGQQYNTGAFQTARMQPAPSASMTPTRQGSGTPQPHTGYANGTPAMVPQQNAS